MTLNGNRLGYGFRFIASIAVGLFAGLQFSTTAWAYFSGKVLVDQAELKQQPRSDAQTIKTIPKGTAFNAADKANNGYYYVRTATDMGWLEGSAIGKSSDQNVSSTAPTAKKSQPRQNQRRQAKSGVRNPFMAKVHIDYSIFSIQELNTATSTTSFSNGTGFGGEFFYFFNPLTAVGLRIDTVGQSITANDQTSNVSYDFSLSTVAFMAGIERILWQDREWYFAGLGYLGLASSSLKITSTDSNAQYSGKPLTFMGMVEGGYKFNGTFSAYGELGYRVLNSSNVTPTTTSTLPAFVGTVSLNFTGPVLGLGVSARF